MASSNMLEVTLDEILRVINPLMEDFETRKLIIDDLREVVSTLDSLRDAIVEPFGSFLSQLYSRWGDLDISIELSNGSHILSAAKKHKQMLLGDVLKALRATGRFNKLQFVSHARVPILKLETRHRHISCDISINNLAGHMKSKFLLWICTIDRRFRDMVLLVKEWAKANHINNPKHGTLNSYSLSLLVIHHFQTCIPPILPPLRDLYPGNMADELIAGVRADVERHIEEVAFGNIAEFRKVRRINRSSLSELFISFLRKFSDISRRATEQGVCTYSGYWENISTNTRWLPQTYAIFIEDPLEQPQNTARAVSAGQLPRIGEVFRNTYCMLMDPNQSRETLIPQLVRYGIYHFFPGVGYPTARGNEMRHSRATQSTHRGNLPSPNNNNQFQPRQVNKCNHSKGQNGQKPSQERAQIFNQQLLKERPGTHPLNMNGLEATQQGQGQALQVAPPWPHTLLPSTSQAKKKTLQSIKASQAQAQQVWRPKNLEK